MCSSNEGRQEHRTHDRERGHKAHRLHGDNTLLKKSLAQRCCNPSVLRSFSNSAAHHSTEEWCSVPLYETGSTCRLREPRTWKEIPKGIITCVGVKNLHRADDHGDQRTHREDGARDDVIAVVSVETPTWKHTSMDWNPQPKDALTST